MIGERLKKAREAKNFKQWVLAKMIGVSNSEISQYETNKKFPRKDKLLKLLDALEVSADYILGRDTGVTCNDTSYIIYLSQKEIEIVMTLRKYENLYELLSSDRMGDIIKKWAAKYN